MGYLEESLSKGEIIERVFEPHWIARALIAAHFLLALLTLGLWLPFAIHAWLALRCLEQGVTNKRVARKSGIISRSTEEMRLASIESIHVEQSFWGRMFGFGALVVAGRGQGTLRLNWIADPLEAKRSIENAEQDRVDASHP